MPDYFSDKQVSHYMMKLTFKIIYFFLVVGLLVYVSLPSPEFPAAPLAATQSHEPADSETPLGRAYFTDLNRDQIMAHYKSQFVGYPTLRLNYPPEEAQTLIRDQTRSSYLEELVHPLRESLYVTGFIPKVRKDAVVIEGREYYQKITVRYVPSKVFVRLIYVLLFSALGYFAIVWSVKLVKGYIDWLRKKLWKK